MKDEGWTGRLRRPPPPFHDKDLAAPPRLEHQIRRPYDYSVQQRYLLHPVAMEVKQRRIKFK